MAKQNFILGHGELLTHEITISHYPGDKVYPYSFTESLDRLCPQFSSVSENIDKLPAETCPGDLAVELITLNPAFIAKSYYPEAFFSAIDLTPIGSRNTKIKPEKWTKRKPPEICTSTQLFVAGRRDILRSISEMAKKFDANGAEALDFRKFEKVELPAPINSKLPQTSKEGYYEIGLHLFPGSESSLIQTEFISYAESLGIKVFNKLAFFAGNLWFLPAYAEYSLIKQLALFTFIRVIRPMPRLRGLPSAMRSGSSLIKARLPQDPPIAQDISVAILDGGIPEEHTISPWLSHYHKQDPKAEDDDAFNDHGLAVTSAFLFGPLDSSQQADRPFAPVSHIRILDNGAEQEDPLLLYRTLGMIEEVLLSRQYQFINLSLGPDLPIDDQEVHAWTSVIDENLADGNTFMTIAVGNNGELDRDVGNARIQVPSDCVNAVSVGAANSLGEVWSRAAYSAIGPGRSPGIVKPDLLAFGGEPGNYFHVLTRGTTPNILPQLGTSFAAPFLLRTAVGIRAYLGNSVSVLAIKALLIHCAKQSNSPQVEVGWGKASEDVDSVISCPDGVARILYQGELRPGKFLRAPIPLPHETLNGMVTIRATFCYASEVDPEDTSTYTRSGLEVSFRPHMERIKQEAPHPKTKSFFEKKAYAMEDELRSDAGKWETVLNAEHTYRATTLSDPCFDIHYNARENGGKSRRRERMCYALVVTILTPKQLNIGEMILRTYPQLIPIQPRIALPIRT